MFKQWQQTQRLLLLKSPPKWKFEPGGVIIYCYSKQFTKHFYFFLLQWLKPHLWNGTRHHYPNAIQSAKNKKKLNIIIKKVKGCIYIYIYILQPILDYLHKENSHFLSLQSNSIACDQLSFYSWFSHYLACAKNRILIEPETARLPFMSRWRCCDIRTWGGEGWVNGVAAC